jgi:hypothetical protein
MALVPVGDLGLVRDTTTGNVFTPGGGFGGRAPTVPEVAVKTAPAPEIPAPEPPPAVTDPGQPYGPKPPGSADKGNAPAQQQPRKENPETVGQQLWIRKWQLTIGTQSGKDAIDLSALAFEFEVNQSTFLVAPQMVVTIHNPGDKVLLKLKELTYIVLEAGYRNSAQYGKIFGGQIAFYKHGHKSATDTFVEIHAMQYDKAHNGAIINTWKAAGYTKKDVIEACVAVMDGVKLGQITDLGDEKSPRGRVFHGMATDVLRDTAHTADAEVWIDTEGYLHLLKPGEALEMQTDTVPVLNSRTGLIDIPSSTMGDGVEIRSLLNPRLVPGGQVKVAEKDVARFSAAQGAESLVKSNQQLLISAEAVKADGYYTVISVKHSGANRGNPWYSDMKTRSLDPTKERPQLQVTG